MKSTYVIIGAGLAGSTCAYLLRKAGADVVLLERQPAMRKDKLCAGLLTPRALDMLQRIFGPAYETLVKSEFSTMRCIVNGKIVDLDDIRMKSVRRKELDDFALSAYLDEGGRLFDSFAIRDIDFAAKTIRGTSFSGDTLVFEYEKLIAADGALSGVRRRLTGAGPDAVLMLEAEVDDTGCPFTMAYDARWFGYSWYAPVGTRAKIGCASYRGSSTELRAQLAQFARDTGIELTRVRGAFCPTGKDVLLHKGDCSFIGDAAGLICPPSGEGIYYALCSARALARACMANASYPALMKRQVEQIARQYKTRDLFFNRTFITLGLFAADATPYGAKRAVKFALKHFAGYEG